MSYQLTRSPNFWDALQVEGRESVIIAIFDNLKDCIAGAMICSFKPVWMHGKQESMGYIGSLKLGSEYKRTIIAARLFVCLKEYCKSIDTYLWFFSVFQNNIEGNSFFKRKSPFLPVFKPLTTSTTYILKSRKLRETTQSKTSISVETVHEGNIDELLLFIEHEAQSRAFVPQYTAQELLHGTGLLLKFNNSHQLIARKNGAICGTMGLWDQSDFRVWKVAHYSKAMKRFRPCINMAASLLNMPMLPKAGNPTPYNIISLMIIENDVCDIFVRLFNSLMEINVKHALYSISLIHNSNFHTYFKKRTVKMHNNLFTGYWQKDEEKFKKMNFENIYLEQGAL